MNTIYKTLLISLLLIGCKEKSREIIKPVSHKVNKSDFFTIKINEKTVVSLAPDSLHVEKLINKYGAEDYLTMIDDIIWYENQMLEKIDSLGIAHVHTDQRKLNIVTPKQQLKIDTDTSTVKWRYYYYDGKELMEKDVFALIEMN